MEQQPIIDAHVHLWEPRTRDWYPALHTFADGAGAPVLLEDHRLADHVAALAPMHVAGLVHVSATTAPHAYLDEATWLETQAEGAPPLVTIGTVDPALDAATRRAHLDEQAARSRFRGIRVFGGLDPESATTREILGWLRDRGLVFDLVADPRSLPDWARTLRAFDGLTVVLEHLGSPYPTDEAARDQWARTMRETAARTSWSCKFSGLGMVLPEITADTLRPWLEGAVEAWGWERLMFGSNMPMDALATTTGELLATMRTLVGEGDQAAAFFSRNAAQAYGI